LCPIVDVEEKEEELYYIKFERDDPAQPKSRKGRSLRQRRRKRRQNWSKL
jgi:hypothetical protein